MSVPIIINFPQSTINATLAADAYDTTIEEVDQAKDLAWSIVLRAVEELPYNPDAVIPAPITKPTNFSNPTFSIKLVAVCEPYPDGTYPDGHRSTMTQKVHEDCQIGDLKAMLCAKGVADPNCLRLVYEGRVLEDGKTCSDYDIKSDDVIAMRIAQNSAW